MTMNDFINELYLIYNSESGKIIYLLVLIMLLMMADIVTGLAKAYVNHSISSHVGKHGLTVKAVTIMVLVIMIPLHVMIPSREVGYMFLYTTYIGYIVFEVTSLFENMKALGIEFNSLKWFTDRLSDENIKHKKEGKK